MSMNRLRLALAALVTVLLTAGCGTSPIGTGQVEVLLTDAPAAEADALVVAFGRIDLVPADESESGIVTVAEEGGEIDVLQLRDGEVALLGGVEVPAGRYSQVRLIVEEATLHFGAETYPVTIPSGAQTGLKVNVQPELVVHQDTSSTVIVDFDVPRAVHETPPGSQNYVLQPTGIRAVTASGVVTGSVVDLNTNLPLEVEGGATVTVYNEAGQEVTTTFTDPTDGSFTIITLTEGSYRLEIGAEGYGTVSVADVQVTAGQTVELDPVALELEAGVETVATD